MSEAKKNRKPNNTLRIIIVFFMALISGIAVNISPEKVTSNKVESNVLSEMIRRFSQQLGEVRFSDMVAVVLAMLLFFYIFVYKKFRFSLTAFWISFILAVFYIIGISYSTFYDSRFIFCDGYQFLVALTTFIGVMMLIYSVMIIFYEILDHKKDREEISYTGVTAKIDKHFFLFCFLFLLLVWLILSIPFFPGSIPYDGRKQLNQYFGRLLMTNHHPYYSTIVMGFIYEIGNSLFGASGGSLLFILLQTVMGAVVFAKICCFIKEHTRGITAGVVSLSFFAFNPLMWTDMQAFQKDTIGFIVFALFMLEFLKIYLEDKVTLKNYIWLGVSGLVHCLFRHEGKFLIFPAFLILIIIIKKRKKAIVTAIVVGVILTAMNSIITYGLKIQPGNRVEAYSIVCQQVARYVKTYKKELTDEEKKNVGKVLKYKELSGAYEPEVADPAKNHYRKKYTDEDWEIFMNQWKAFFKRHPGVYIDAAIDEMFGYIYPFYFYRGMRYFQLYNKGSVGEFDKDVVYSEYFMEEDIRQLFRSSINIWDKIPLLSILINCGAYTWLGIVLLGAIIRKGNWRSALIFLIPAISIGICFASPVNGYIRYMMREVSVMPLYILITVMCYSKLIVNKDDESEESDEPEAVAEPVSE